MMCDAMASAGDRRKRALGVSRSRGGDVPRFVAPKLA